MNTGVGERIIIPRDAAELVLLQRTAHSVIGRIPGIRRLLPEPVNDNGTLYGIN